MTLPLGNLGCANETFHLRIPVLASSQHEVQRQALLRHLCPMSSSVSKRTGTTGRSPGSPARLLLSRPQALSDQEHLLQAHQVALCQSQCQLPPHHLYQNFHLNCRATRRLSDQLQISFEAFCKTMSENQLRSCKRAGRIPVLPLVGLPWLLTAQNGDLLSQSQTLLAFTLHPISQAKHCQSSNLLYPHLQLIQSPHRWKS